MIATLEQYCKPNVVRGATILSDLSFAVERQADDRLVVLDLLTVRFHPTVANSTIPWPDRPQRPAWNICIMHLMDKYSCAVLPNLWVVGKFLALFHTHTRARSGRLQDICPLKWVVFQLLCIMCVTLDCCAYEQREIGKAFFVKLNQVSIAYGTRKVVKGPLSACALVEIIVF